MANDRVSGGEGAPPPRHPLRVGGQEAVRGVVQASQDLANAEGSWLRPANGRGLPIEVSERLPPVQGEAVAVWSGRLGESSRLKMPQQTHDGAAPWSRIPENDIAPPMDGRRASAIQRFLRLMTHAAHSRSRRGGSPASFDEQSAAGLSRVENACYLSRASAE